MTMQVLLEKQQIDIARQLLLGMGVSSTDSYFRALMRKMRLLRGVAVGDRSKSWDVCTTIEFIKDHVRRQEPILDIGCFASEVIIALHKIGYTNLTGADLNPNLKLMPYQEHIRYEITNFMQTIFEDASFQAITSISVIEHGFDGFSLLKEMSRLLKPNGYFFASFDYWPDKIDTSGDRIFGMDWTIFSRQEVLDFIDLAANYGLFPVGYLNVESKDKIINFDGKEYTFAWLALQKRV